MNMFAKGGEQSGERACEPRASERTARPNLRNSLLLKHVAFLTLVVIVASGVLGHVAYLLARGMLLDDVHERFELIVAARARLLESSAAEELREVALVVSRTRMGRLVEGRVAGTVDGTLFHQEIERILADTKKSGGGVRQLWIADPQGKVIATTQESLLGQSVADHPLFVEGVRRASLGDPYQRRGRYVGVVAAPIQSEDGAVTGVLMGELDVTALMDSVFDRSGLGESGEIVVGRYRQEKLEVLPAPRTEPGRAEAESKNPALAKACQGESGAEVVDDNGLPVLAAYRPVAYGAPDEAPWGMVAKINLEEAYAPTGRLRRILFYVQGGFALVGAAASYCLARRLTRPILELTSTAASLASGDFETRVKVDRSDELGVLGASFNNMAEQLEKSRSWLERRIELGAAELTESRHELYRQTRILRSVLDSMGDAVAVADSSGKALLLNPAAERILGQDAQDVPPSEWPRVYGCYHADGETLYAPEDLPLARAMRGESIDSVELMVRHAGMPEPRWISVNARPLKDETGRLCGGVIAFRDVTDAKRAEEEIRVAEQVNRTILATAHEAFITIDSDGLIVKWNNQAEATFGWSAEEAVGRRLADTIIPTRYVAAHLAGFRRFLETGDEAFFNQRHDLTAMRRDGREFPVEVTVAPIRLKHAFLFSAFIRDVTEPRRAKQELQRAKQLAESASRAKSEFLANMSHEIRTPMNAIIGMTELMLETSLTPTQREYLTMVQESSESLLSVINDILDFSKIEAGRFELEQAPFDLREVLGDTMKSLALRAHRKGLELACHVSPEIPPFLVGDKHRLRQIIVNLVGNAVKFTEHGEVVLDATCDSRCAGSAVLHFIVRDTGVGIPDAKQRMIFEPFEQADESTTRRFGGTGLGLTISSRLVRFMGGRLWVRSQLGKGSQFHFTAAFALSDGEPQSPPAREEASLHGVRALVVDDNRTNCFILEEMLRSWEMQPTALTDPAQAILVMRERRHDGRPFDVALIDANMPVMNGFQLVEQIKRDPELNAAVVIVLTSGSRAESLCRQAHRHIAACLTKPVKQSELFDAISQCLGYVSTPQPLPVAADGAASEIRLPSLRILLVEDSPINQKLALALLQPRGHQVTVADNGAEAVREYAAGSFDLVLMDVQMPEMDGLEATRLIRELERKSGRRTPILAMTAHAIKGDRELCLQAGMDAYVSKPVRARGLFSAIQQLLAGQTSPEAGRQDDQSRAAAPDEAEPESKSASAEDVAEPPPAASETTSSETTSSDTKNAVIDWHAASVRSHLDEDQLHELAELFLQECPKLLSEMREAVAEADAGRLRLAAHTLKGSAAIFDAKRAAGAAQRLESQALAGDFSQADAMIAELESEIRHLAAAIDEHVKHA